MAALTQPEGFLRYHELLWHLHLFLSYPKLVPCFHPPFAHPACTPCYHKGPAVVFTLRTTTPKANSCHHGVHGNKQSQKTSRVGGFFVFFFEGTTTRG